MTEKLTSAHMRFLKDIWADDRLRPADRNEDKIRQYCRRKGLAEVKKNPRRWELTARGLEVLNGKGEA
jgi:hypothetical protein